MARSRSDTILERVVFAGFVATIVGEWWMLRRRPRRTPGDLDHATRAELSDPSLPADPLVAVGYERRDTAASLTMLAGSVAIGLATDVVLGPVERRLHRHRIGAIRSKPVAFVAAFVLWDFLYYWEHRWMHEVRLFWAHHVTHHSSERYNLSTALRQPWSPFLMRWVFWPMPLLGFSPAVTRRAGEINLLYQYWIHTEVVDRMAPAAERVLNTPSHHRVHHGANPQYLDRNYAGVLICWDKWFGTFEPEVRRVKYGLTKNIRTFNPITIGYHEFAALVHDVRRARGWRDRAGYVFGRPGWAPSGVAAAVERQTERDQRGDDRREPDEPARTAEDLVG